jgi:hypothetical protein
MTGWEGWKLPVNWRDIIEEHIEMFDRNVSSLLAEPDIDDETKAIIAAIADQKIDSMRGTFLKVQ